MSREHAEQELAKLLENVSDDLEQLGELAAIYVVAAGTNGVIFAGRADKNRATRLISSVIHDALNEHRRAIQMAIVADMAQESSENADTGAMLKRLVELLEDLAARQPSADTKEPSDTIKH